MKRIAIFCSNPINGGTAEVFVQLVSSLEKKAVNSQILPCVNENNPVKVYNTLQSLNKLNIMSEKDMFNNSFYNGNFINRIVNKIRRKAGYRKIEKENINKIICFLEENKIDSVLVHNGGYVGDDLCNQFIHAAYICNIPERIMVFHNDFEKNILQKFRYLPYDKKITNETTGIVTVSNYTKNRLKEQSFLNREIKVIYNGLKEKDMVPQETKTKVNIGSDKINVLMIGNFMCNKGQIHFLQAINIIKEKHQLDHLHFTIIGNIYEENYYHQCMKYINDNDLHNHISIYHNIFNAGDYTTYFDIVTVTSIADESFGLVAVEAMEHSIPVIAFACGGIPEVVKNNVTGIIMPIGNSDQLACSIISLSKDNLLRKKMGQAARKRYENNFSIEHMTQKYMEYLGLEE